MTVLAIDPGSELSALVLWDGRRPLRHAILTNDEMLAALRQPELRPNFVACEMIASYGMAVGSEVFETCVWIGRFFEACAAQNIRFERPFRRDVKMHLCADPKAKDTNIRQALIDRLGGKLKAIGTKKEPGPLYEIHSHCWAALGVGVTSLDKFHQHGWTLP